MEFREREGRSFEEAERRHAELKRRYDADQIGDEQFDAERQALVVLDDEGRSWAKSREGGRWLYHDGGAWIEATPPGFHQRAGSQSSPERPQLRKQGGYDGGNLAPSRGEEEAQPRGARADQGRYCANCGAPVGSKSTFCASCGEYLITEAGASLASEIASGQPGHGPTDQQPGGRKSGLMIGLGVLGAVLVLGLVAVISYPLVAGEETAEVTPSSSSSETPPASPPSGANVDRFGPTTTAEDEPAAEDSENTPVIQPEQPPPSPSSEVPLDTVESVDWRNTRYQVDCGRGESLFKTVDVQNGEGYAPADASSGGYAYDISVQAVATGDLTGDGRPEAAVQVYCAGGPTASYVTTRLQVFTDGPDGPQLLARLKPPPPSNPDTYPPRFSGFPYGGTPVLLIRSGQLVTGVDYYAARDAHLAPSIHQDLTWQWDGTQFTSDQPEPSPPEEEVISETPSYEEELRTFAEDYYDAVALEDWEYLYALQDSQTMQKYTEDEYVQRNQYFAELDSLIETSTTISSEVSTSSLVEVAITQTFESGATNSRVTYFVWEDGSWKHHFSDEDDAIFLPDASYEEFVEANGGEQSTQGDPGSDVEVDAEADAAQAVEDFYVSAAEGDYERASELLTTSALETYFPSGDFEEAFGTLESIRFIEGPAAEVSGDTATVTATTVAELTNRTEQLRGTWTLVNEGGEWKLNSWDVEPDQYS